MQKSTKIIVALLLVAGALDAGTTFVGAQPRNENYVTAFYPNGDMQRYTIYQVNPETRIAFLPFLTTAIYGAAIYGIMRIIGTSQKFRKSGYVSVVWLIAFAFSGGINNILVLGGIIK